MDTPANASSNSAVLDRLVELARHRPFAASQIGALTKHELKKIDAESNTYFTIYRSPADPAQEISAVEVREPTERSAGKGGMLLLDLVGGCIKRDDVGDRFGEPASLVSPPGRPNLPKDTPEYVIYKQPWGVVRLGFSPTTECLVKAVLDATE